MKICNLNRTYTLPVVNQTAVASKSEASTDTDLEETLSALKSVAYGALGLGQPGSEENQDTYYTVGKAIAGVVTVGSIISVWA